jgi:catechol 2,3-dioxygenase-like lactoylglutathione lyase family enzyme
MSLKDSSVLPVVAVDDLDRASRFYQDKLGCTIVRIPDDPTSVYAQIRQGSGILLYKSGFRRGETTAASFLVSDVEGTVGELRSRGVTFEDYDLPGLKTVDGVATVGRIKAAWFKDTEGNTLAITLENEEIMRMAA